MDPSWDPYGQAGISTSDALLSMLAASDPSLMQAAAASASARSSQEGQYQLPGIFGGQATSAKDDEEGVVMKRTMCRFFQMGSCHRGITCTFAHGEKDINFNGKKTKPVGNTGEYNWLKKAKPNDWHTNAAGVDGNNNLVTRPDKKASNDAGVEVANGEGFLDWNTLSMSSEPAAVPATLITGLATTPKPKPVDQSGPSQASLIPTRMKFRPKTR